MSNELLNPLPLQDDCSAATGVTRRDLFRRGGVLTLPVLLGAARVEAGGAAAGPLTPGPRIYQSIGVEPIINCRGTFTIIGGSVERTEVLAAMHAAALQFVQIDELADGVGARLAEITGAEWGMVSAGCAAGLKHVTAACVTGGNPERLVRIPDLTGFEKTEVIIPRGSRNAYDAAVRNIGVTIVSIDAPEDLAHAITSKTAMIYMLSEDQTSNPVPVDEIARFAAPRGVPILVDAAAEILTIPNVHLQRGASVVAYSGGKAICGPQCAGLLLGRKDLLMSAWQASSPHHGPGRDNKVGREEMLGMLAAVEAWTARDHEAEWKQWLAWLDRIGRRVSSISGVTTTVREPRGLSNRSPSLVISWDPAELHVTGEELADELASTTPRIAVGSGGGRGPQADTSTTAITVTAWMMQPGNDEVVAERIHTLLSRQRAPKPTAVPSPAASLAGRWEVKIEFFSSTGTHTLFLEQDGNRLRGSHQGEFSTRDIVGTIEGDQVRLRSTERRPGSTVTFTFAGTLAEDAISGPLYMGEYLNASFTARRQPYPDARPTIRIPAGRPLAT